jgi:WD40 repeat protein
MKLLKTFHIDDGTKRGPLAMARVRFHPTAPALFAACSERRLAVWDTTAAPVKQKNNTEAVPGKLVAGHDAGWVRGFAVAPTGGWLVTAGSDRKLRKWAWDGKGVGDTPAADVAAHAGWVEGVAVSPDGNSVVSVGADKTIKLWTPDLKPVKSADAHKGIPRYVTFTPDGKQIVSAGEDGFAVVWDAAGLKPIRQIEFGDTSEQQGQNPAFGGIFAVAVSPDGKWLAGGTGRISRLFELATGKLAAAVPQAGMDVAFAKTGTFATGENSIVAMAVDFDKLKPLPDAPPGKGGGKNQLPNAPKPPGKELGTVKRGDFSLGLAFSPDGKQLAAGKSNGTVELWEV